MQAFTSLPLSSRIIKDCHSKPWQSDTALNFPRGKYRNWNEIGMNNAVKAVRQGTSVRRAAELFNVPKSTLSDKVLGKVPMRARSGPPSYLTIEEEEELTSFLLELAKIGYALTRKEVIAIVQRVVDSKNISAIVSNGWWERYVNRHPQITLRVAVPFSMARAMASDRDVIDRYFDMLEDCLKSNEIYNKPSCIFNCDESGIPLNPKSLKVIDKVGSKNPSYLSGGCKAQITVLACTCASGYAIPPLVIFDRMTLNEALTRGEVPGTIYGLSHNGWITREIFNRWFEHFLRSVPSVRPILLLLDGHSSHYCPETIRMAAEQQVILCALPPHTTHITQPLDRGCFAPLKVNWRQICHKFCCLNPGRTVSRYDFCELFAKAWFKSFTMENVIGSFAATGIYPFNRNAIELPEDDKSFEVFKPCSLPERTNLAYIPLYSPARPHHPTELSFSRDLTRTSYTSTPSSYLYKPRKDDDFSPTFSSPLSFSSPLTGVHSKSEPSLLDESIFKPQPLPCATTISKFLVRPDPPSKIPTKRGKSAGKVLTSLENLHQIQEREKEKQAAALMKEERKRLREIRKIEKSKENKKTCLKTKSKGTSASCKTVKILDYLSECSDEDFLPLDSDEYPLQSGAGRTTVNTRSSKQAAGGTRADSKLQHLEDTQPVGKKRAGKSSVLPDSDECPLQSGAGRTTVNTRSSKQAAGGTRADSKLQHLEDTQPVGKKRAGKSSVLPDFDVSEPCGSGGTLDTRSSKLDEKACSTNVNKTVYISDSDADPDLKWWIEGLSLYEEDKEILLSGQELTDSIINAAQSLLSLQFIHIGGLQDTIFGHHLNYKAVDPCVSSVQILHTGESNHWICTCSSSKEKSTVIVMDSLGLFMDLNNSTLLQISKIYNSTVPRNESSLKIRKLSVQQQKGSLDCGVFSVAYAVEVCMGRNPQYAFFDQEKMRQHLCICLSEGTLKPFPGMSSRSEELPRPALTLITVNLYCKCRMPEEYDDMVCCDVCDRWYHFQCLNLRSENLPKKWMCYSCAI